jgi:hypothetical protein
MELKARPTTIAVVDKKWEIKGKAAGNVQERVSYNPDGHRVNKDEKVKKDRKKDGNRRCAMAQRCEGAKMKDPG